MQMLIRVCGPGIGRELRIETERAVVLTRTAIESTRVASRQLPKPAEGG